MGQKGDPGTRAECVSGSARLRLAAFSTLRFDQDVGCPSELSNVIITRLPFAVPDHPPIETRKVEAGDGRQVACAGASRTLPVG